MVLNQQLYVHGILIQVWYRFQLNGIIILIQIFVFIQQGMFDGVKATIPLLDPKYAVDRIIDCVLKDQMQVVLPRFMYSMLFCKSILPTLAGKCKCDA